MKYSIDKWKQGRYTAYTIWDNYKQEPVEDFTRQDYINPKKEAKLKLEKLINTL